MLVYKDTLREALPLRARPGAVGLILSLEGVRYYVFHSRQTRDQLASSNLGNKLDMHRELLGLPAFTAIARQQEYQRLIPVARAVAAQNPIDPSGRHAEEVLIESWDECLQNFISLRGRPPSKAEVFLTHCPCQITNQAPSPARMLANRQYPTSCHNKLRQFCTTGNRAAISWKIYYEAPFGGAIGLNETLQNLTISLLPNYINMQ